MYQALHDAIDKAETERATEALTGMADGAGKEAAIKAHAEKAAKAVKDNLTMGSNNAVSIVSWHVDYVMPPHIAEIDKQRYELRR